MFDFYFGYATLLLKTEELKGIMGIKEYLAANNIMCKDFAAKCGITPTYLSMIIHGRRPCSKKKAIRIEEESDFAISKIDLMFPGEFGVNSNNILKRHSV